MLVTSMVMLVTSMVMLVTSMVMLMTSMVTPATFAVGEDSQKSESWSCLEP